MPSTTAEPSAAQSRRPVCNRSPRLLILLLLLGMPSILPGEAPSEPGKDSPDTDPHEALKSIVDTENTLSLIDGEANRSFNQQLEFSSLAEAISRDYQHWIEQNPEEVLGPILFGKFLVRLDRREEAHAQFTRANRIDPHIPVVNQQLGNFAAETGDYSTAFFHLRKAAILAPKEAIYHYQLGELIFTYKRDLVRNRDLSLSEAEELMVESFASASSLAPEIRDFALRHAECYFDILQPDWNHALKLWDGLLATTDSLFERDVIRLRKAQVLAKTGRFHEARELAGKVSQETLLEAQRKIIDKLP